MQNDPEYLRSNRQATTLTWIGHATVLLQFGGLNIITDPHFSLRASPVQWFGPRRLVPPGLALEQLPPIDLLLLSHNHYDHLDRPTIRRLARLPFPPRLCLAPLGLARTLRQWGLSRVEELDWWDTHAFEGLEVRCVPVRHSSVRRGLDRDRTLWSGWRLKHPELTFLFIGDTAYSRDFAEIRARLGPTDLAALPIGAYEPRWFMRYVHASPEEAVRIHQDLGCRRSIATHWGTFILTDEPPDEPPLRLVEARQKAGLDDRDFLVLGHGETIRPLDPEPRTGPSWGP